MASDYDLITKENIRRRGEEFDDIGAFIAEQLYSDRTHFVYELLQNAEDAGATRVSFRLLSTMLEVHHDGRPFNESDVRAVCDVLKGTKKGDAAKIGKFGIGFKSVYAFTSSPEIHSGDEHFCIKRYIRPCAVDARKMENPWTTFFVFPFNHNEIPPNQAFQEIGNRLEALNPRTLLFLRNIKEIKWKVEDRMEGVYRRNTRKLGPARRVSAVSQGGIKKTEESWLVFGRPVMQPDSSASLRVEVAFWLTRDEKSNKKVIKQINNPDLVVFFPTNKRTNLGFLIQGPYRTTPARNDIYNDDGWNKKLILETAILVVETLPKLRELNLLSVSLLEAMPIHPSDFTDDSMFHPLYDHIRVALREQPLLPTYDGKFVAAKHAKLARGTELHTLLSGHQLQEFFGSDCELKWLSSEITVIRTPGLWRYLREQLTVDTVTPESFANQITASFIEQQTDEWIAELYRFLAGQEDLWRAARNPSDRPGPLRNKPFIRLHDGTHVPPFCEDGSPNAYLPSEEETEFPTVKRKLVVDLQARKFLENLGLREPDFVAEVIERILPKYQSEEVSRIDDAQHHRDIEKIISALETDSASRKEDLVGKLKKTPFLRALNAGTGCRAYMQPETIYVRSSELEMYFQGNQDAWFLEDTYNQYHQQLGDLGVSYAVRVQFSYGKPGESGYVPLLDKHGYHVRGIGGFTYYCEIDGLEHAVIHPTPEKAAYVWNTLLLPNVQYIYGTIEFSKRSTYEKSTQLETPSSMGKIARDNAWLPDRYGKSHKPCDLSLDDLPDDFERDENLAKKLGMKPTSLATLAKEAGVNLEDIEFLAKHREEFEEFKKWKGKHGAQHEAHESDIDLQHTAVDYGDALAQAFARPGPTEDPYELPQPGPIIDPDRRRLRTADEIKKGISEEPHRGTRFKIVPARQWEDKNNQVRVFLQEQYGGKCQICNDTFPKRDGRPYFEGLYLVPHTQARWIDRPGNVLSLCATCSAKFQHGSVVAGDVREQVQAFRGRAEGGNGKPRLRIKLCGQDTEICFTERHMIDLQEMIKACSDNS